MIRAAILATTADHATAVLLLHHETGGAVVQVGDLQTERALGLVNDGAARGGRLCFR